MPIYQTMPQALKNFAAQKNAPEGGAIGKGLASLADPETWQKGADKLYEKAAMTQDSRDFRALADQIDAVLANDIGALMIRYTRRQPNGADQTIPWYIGLVVVGGGPDKDTAIARYHKREQSREDSAAKICTPLNPTGKRAPAPDTMEATPQGMNIAYNSQLAAKIMKVYERNPRNQESSGIISRDYVEETFVFLDRKAWSKIRQG